MKTTPSGYGVVWRPRGLRFAVIKVQLATASLRGRQGRGGVARYSTNCRQVWWLCLRRLGYVQSVRAERPSFAGRAARIKATRAVSDYATLNILTRQIVSPAVELLVRAPAPM
jgi:hypothetical protein